MRDKIDYNIGLLLIDYGVKVLVTNAENVLNGIYHHFNYNSVTLYKSIR